MNSWDDIDNLVKRWLKEARSTIIASFTTVLDIHTKENANDLVTNMDREIEKFFANNIRSHFPDHKIVGEEGFGDHVTDVRGVIWFIDPIDGTMNFVHQQRNFFISVGIYEDGIGKLGYLFDVVHNELYYSKVHEGAYWNDQRLPKLEERFIEEAIVGCSANWLTSNRYFDPTKTLIPLVNDVRGTRSYGSAALEFAYVATGRLDAYISMRLAPWDFAGGKIIVEELGGVVTDLSGNQLNILQKSPLIAAKPKLHEKIIEEYLKKK